MSILGFGLLFGRKGVSCLIFIGFGSLGFALGLAFRSLPNLYYVIELGRNFSNELLPGFQVIVI